MSLTAYPVTNHNNSIQYFRQNNYLPVTGWYKEDDGTYCTPIYYFEDPAMGTHYLTYMHPSEGPKQDNTVGYLRPRYIGRNNE